MTSVVVATTDTPRARSCLGLTAAGLCWGPNGSPIVENVDLTARAGRVLGVLGPNGAGKTSLLRILAGLRRPDAGRVELGGRTLARMPRADVARSLAIVEQSPDVHFDVTVEQAVAIGRTPYRGAFSALSAGDGRAIARARASLGLTKLRHRNWSSLSGGERQRVQVARALAQEPSVILLDEPTNHLDIRFQMEVLSLLRNSELTVVAALHDLNLAARYCDDLLIMDGGRVVAAGTPEQVLNEGMVSRVYGVRSVVEASRHYDGMQITYLGT